MHMGSDGQIGQSALFFVACGSSQESPQSVQSDSGLGCLDVLTQVCMASSSVCCVPAGCWCQDSQAAGAELWHSGADMPAAGGPV